MAGSSGVEEEETAGVRGDCGLDKWAKGGGGLGEGLRGPGWGGGMRGSEVGLGDRGRGAVGGPL